MYAVVYQFTIQPNTNEVFENAWTELTKLIYTHAGGLGSRLHKINANTYFAYAQWPSADVFEQPNDLPIEAEKFRKVMKDCCVAVETISKGEMQTDLLRNF